MKKGPITQQEGT